MSLPVDGESQEEFQPLDRAIETSLIQCGIGRIHTLAISLLSSTLSQQTGVIIAAAAASTLLLHRLQIFHLPEWEQAEVEDTPPIIDSIEALTQACSVHAKAKKCELIGLEVRDFIDLKWAVLKLPKACSFDKLSSPQPFYINLPACCIQDNIRGALLLK